MSIKAYLFGVAVLHVLLGHTAAEGIPEIRVPYLEILDPSGFKIRWVPVEMKNVTDPIIGIKIKVWRTPCEIKTTLKHEGDTLVEIVQSKRLKFNRSTIPQELPENVYIVKPDEESLTVPHVDPEVWYHVRVLAFTKTAEGPHSEQTQFKINTNDKNDKKKSCEKIISKRVIKDTLLN